MDGQLLGRIAIALFHVGEATTQGQGHVQTQPLSTGAKTALDHRPRANLAITTLVQVGFNKSYLHGGRKFTFKTNFMVN